VGLPQKGGGGVRYRRSTIYLTIPYESQRFGLDAMNNPRKSISGVTVRTLDLAPEAIQQ
jgi:hypothetical protein